MEASFATPSSFLRPLVYCSITTTTTIPISPKIGRLPIFLQFPSKSASSLHFRHSLGSRSPSASTGLWLPSRFTPTVLLAAQESQLSVGDSTETREWAVQDFYSLRRDVETTSRRVEEIRESAGLKKLEDDLADLERAAADISFWDDRVRAQQTLLALNDVKDKIGLLTEFKIQIEDAETIVNLTEEMDSIDATLLEEASSIVKELNKALDHFELTQLLSGPYDKEGAVIYITAGAGGTDAQCRIGLTCFSECM